MKALITGANGTVGRALTAHLESLGHSWISWNRAEVSIDSYHDMEAYVRACDPDAIFHLAICSSPTGMENENWLVNFQWPSELAWISRILSIPFVFTSTVMVFAADQQGPFAPADTPLSKEDYGSIKRQTELKVLSQNPNAHIARLGWQIGDAPGSNNMIDFLHKQQEEHGEIRASRLWFPACSFIQDTAAALASLPEMSRGLYQLDENHGWSFVEIVKALKEQHRTLWNIVETEDFSQDQRMLDQHIAMPSLRERLPGLPELEMKD